jgi:NitT/TauT family transport system permease protein
LCEHAPQAILRGVFLYSPRVTEHPQTHHPRRPAIGRRLAPLLALAALLALWELLVAVKQYPSFFLPSPRAVWARGLIALRDGSLLMHTWITLREVFAGLFAGLSVAVVLGYFLAKTPALERLIAPYLAASQAIPIVALAPLLVIWLGPGMSSKVVVCALTLFFPVLVNTIVGLRSVDPELRELLCSLQASRWQSFVYLEIPAALPVLLGGLKIGVTLSVIGAVVSEFVSADRGLGFLVNLARGLFDTPLMFVALITLMTIALSLYLLVSELERRVLRRQGRE